MSRARQGRARAPGALAPEVGLASCSPQEGPAGSVSAPFGAWPGPSSPHAGLQDTWGRPVCLGESVPGEAHAGRLVPSAQTSPWARSTHHRAPRRAPPPTRQLKSMSSASAGPTHVRHTSLLGGGGGGRERGSRRAGPQPRTESRVRTGTQSSQGQGRVICHLWAQGQGLRSGPTPFQHIM